MATSDYNPVSWNGEPITTDKLNQMCNNTQFIFDRTPRVRYTNEKLVRDQSIKVLAGKTAYAQSDEDNEWVTISFGNFFSAGCVPVVTATAEPLGYFRRMAIAVSGLDFNNLDNSGFQAIVWNGEVAASNIKIDSTGWIHWVAVGY